MSYRCRLRQATAEREIAARLITFFPGPGSESPWLFRG
jgi:hypothetical protein